MRSVIRTALCAAFAFVGMSLSPGILSHGMAQQPNPTAPAPSMPSMPGMTMPGMTRAPGDPGASPSANAFKAANDKMMAGMNAARTGDADQDFVAGMLPHHQGAVDMARIELQYGKDPAMRRLASAIIKAQEKEIAEMTAWQKKHPLTR